MMPIMPVNFCYISCYFSCLGMASSPFSFEVRRVESQASVAKLVTLPGDRVQSPMLLAGARRHDYGRSPPSALTNDILRLKYGSDGELIGLTVQVY